MKTSREREAISHLEELVKELRGSMIENGEIHSPEWVDTKISPKLMQLIKAIESSTQPEVTFEALFSEHKDFALKQFPDSNHISSLRGLEREIKEVEQEPLGTAEQVTEYADCLMYLMDSINRAGIEPKILKQAFEDKLAINKKREWSKNNDGSYSHVKPEVKEEVVHDSDWLENEEYWAALPTIISDQSNWIKAYAQFYHSHMLSKSSLSLSRTVNAEDCIEGYKKYLTKEGNKIRVSEVLAINFTFYWLHKHSKGVEESFKRLNEVWGDDADGKYKAMWDKHSKEESNIKDFTADIFYKPNKEESNVDNATYSTCCNYLFTPNERNICNKCGKPCGRVKDMNNAIPSIDIEGIRDKLEAVKCDFDKEDSYQHGYHDAIAHAIALFEPKNNNNKA